ncbi:MAG: hypothetical protein K9N06_06320 [Candidatus Cloacimonetes bacterium]|nr:hypothetical protein [Candidatus Cloacimonadota bacterium]
MNKLFFLLFLTIFLFSAAKIAADFNYLTPPEVTGKYCPDYEVVAENYISGELYNYSFNFAENSGEMVLLTSNEDNFNLHYLNRDGSIRWKKELPLEEIQYEPEISADGSIVLLRKRNVKAVDPDSAFYFFDEMRIPIYHEECRNFVYDREGNLLLDKQFDSQILMLPPLGNFLLLRSRKYHNEPNLSYLDLDGTQHDIPLPDQYNFKRLDYQFVCEDKLLLSLSKSKDSGKILVFYQYRNSEFQRLWLREFRELKYPFVIPNIISTEQWTGICLDKDSFLFLDNKNGETFLEIKEQLQSWISNKDGYLLTLNIDKNECYSYTGDHEFLETITLPGGHIPYYYSFTERPEAFYLGVYSRQLYDKKPNMIIYADDGIFATQGKLYFLKTDEGEFISTVILKEGFHCTLYRKK